ncbi:MAG: DUF3108 domain-containing protein [Candidatus Omnitrophica bacterium]|nr:DUF3108 domain-containing protein [Candidatus Omnitrophota bacterium]
MFDKFVPSLPLTLNPLPHRGRGEGEGVKTGYEFIKQPASFLFFCLLLAAPNASAEETPPQKLFVGEKLVYSVRLLGIEVGRGEAEVKEIVRVRDRDAYHVEIQVRSARIIDWIYKVRDTHHSYIDVERLHSLRYEKILREGRYRADEVMEYDQVNHTAAYYSRKNGSRKEMRIPPDVQDQLSCGFWFRLQEIQPGTEISIPVNADEKNWSLRVKVLRETKVQLKGFPEFEAVEVEPEIQFQGIFVKRGKIRGWLSLDSRRIPLKMTVKVPVLGSVTARLVNYRHPNELGLN